MAREAYTTDTRRMAVPERTARRKRRSGSPALYGVVITLILLSAGVVLSLTVFFEIDSVTAVGVDKYPPDKIVTASGIEIGENLFRIDSGDVSERILNAFPYIEKVDVRLKLPHSVQLEITQCVPAGALLDKDEYLLITREGKVLERGLIFIPEHIPLITGIETGSAQPGDSLQGADEMLRVLDYLFKAINETGFGEITNVKLDDPYNMKVVYENRLLLKLGTEAEMPVKLTFLKELIANQLAPDAQGIIDASGADRSYIYTEMPIEDALAGKKRPSTPVVPEETEAAAEPPASAENAPSS